MTEQNTSKYSQYLPRVYQKRSEESEADYFLGRFLKAFEDMLTGPSDKKMDILGVEAILDRFDEYLDPFKTPVQLLNWLAGWVGLELEDSRDFYGEQDYLEKDNIYNQLLPLNESRQSINRNMIGSEVQLYKILGTYGGLLKHLELYAGEEITITINEFEELAKIGEVGRIGVGTMVGKANPFFFSVHAMIPTHNNEILQKKVRVIKKVIEREKPIYANYILTTEIPAMRVGIYSKVGKSTLVGSMDI